MLPQNLLYVLLVFFFLSVPFSLPPFLLVILSISLIYFFSCYYKNDFILILGLEVQIFVILESLEKKKKTSDQAKVGLRLKTNLLGGRGGKREF